MFPNPLLGFGFDNLKKNLIIEHEYKMILHIWRQLIKHLELLTRNKQA